ncbi:MAG: hypothetical protein JNJ54_20310 [Myxococcaceae bacterium]|nr:hypothetical protein [Myxococcaceae bacterium]
MMTSLVLVLLAAAPKEGSYTFEGGSGSLVLGKGRFTIEVVGANAHLCQLSGEWKGERGVVNDDGERCEVTFAAAGDQVKVSGEGEACRSYCGARAYFDGTYLLPPKGCSGPEVKKTRADFKKLYDAKRFADAVATLTPLVQRCEAVIDRFDRAWIRNDLAIAQHHAGDDKSCLATLEGLADYRDAPPNEPVGFEPSYEELHTRLAKATRTNATRCGFTWPAPAKKDAR